MLEKLFLNASVNLVGYVIIGALNLILTGLIIRAWGLDGYAVFILIRLLTPIGYFNILDFGMFESTVRNIAKYRSSTKEVNQVFPLSLLYIICVGALTSLLMLFLGGHLLGFLGLNDTLKLDQQPTFSWVVFLVIIQIPLFIMVFFESVIKGYEKFLFLRLVDLLVVSSCLVLLVFWSSHDVQLFHFIYFYYTVLGLKLIALLILIGQTDIGFSRFGIPSIPVRHDVFKHSSTMGVGKMISTSIENIPLVVLSGFANLELAGAYDAIMRIPRFIKANMGNVNSVIIPYAAALNKIDFDRSKAGLVVLTTKYQSMLFTPLLMLGLVFSEQILVIWMGQEYIAYSLSMKLCFVVPLMILCIGASSSVSISDQKIIKALNYINIARLLAYVMLAFILFEKFPLEAFIFANIISYGFTGILVLRLFRHHFGVLIRELTKPVLLSVSISAIILAFGLEIFIWAGDTDPLFALIAAAGSLAATCFALYSQLLSRSEKQKFVTFVRNNISSAR